jgi:O-antigen ligase
MHPSRRYVLLLQEDKGGSANLRQQYWSNGLETAREDDYLGSGVGSWKRDSEAAGFEARYPHNLYLEVLIEQGIAGVIAVLVFVGAVVVSGIRLLTGSKSLGILFLTVGSLLGFVYALLNAQLSGDLYDNRFVWFYAGTVAACWAMETDRGFKRIRQ